MNSWLSANCASRIGTRRVLYTHLAQGYSSDLSEVAGCFHAVLPLMLDTLATARDGRGIRAVVADASGARFPLDLAASTDYVSGRYAPPNDSLVATPCGTRPQRVALSLVGMALSQFGAAVDTTALQLLARTLDAQTGRIAHGATEQRR